MKERVTLSLDSETAAYLGQRAEAETGGNVSALVDRLVQQARLAEGIRAETAWYAQRPDHAEDAEAERHAA